MLKFSLIKLRIALYYLNLFNDLKKMLNNEC